MVKYINFKANLIIPDFSIGKSAPSDSEGALGQIRRESGLISEVSQILRAHKKVRLKNPGYPAKREKSRKGFLAASLRANFAIAKFGIIWIIVGFVLSAQVKLFADITGSAHDFSGVSMTGSKGEMCRVCHVPHKGRSTEAPLWRANLSSPVITYNLYSSNTLEAAVNQPAASTKACLSCHDGSTARSPANGCTACHQKNQLGIDLANDHPVSFVYDGALATVDGGLRNPSVDKISGGGSLNGKFIKDGMLIDDKLECSSCHDVHAKKGDSATAPHLLLIDNNQDKLCLTCHNK